MPEYRHEQQPGLGGALNAVYGVVPDTREIRVSRALGRLLTTALKRAGSLVIRATGSGRNAHGRPFAS